MALRIISNSFIFLWALWVAGYDLKFHLIRNDLLLLSIPILWPSLWISGQHLHIDTATLLMVTFFGIAGISNLIGMGDVKLALILAPWLHTANWRISLIALLVSTWLQVIVLAAKKGKFPRNIALAPAILIACAVNLAT